MDWDKLRIFHAVASAGSFTHAGQSLGLSQSAVMSDKLRNRLKLLGIEEHVALERTVGEALQGSDEAVARSLVVARAVDLA